MLQRRALLAASAWAIAAQANTVQRGRGLTFPRDHGAHLQAHIEWWYVTGWLGPDAAPTHGFQLTFFRHATGIAPSTGRFGASQLMLAHAAMTQLATGQHQGAQRMARWNGEPGAAAAAAAEHDAAVHMGAWWLRRTATGWALAFDTPQGRLELALHSTQPLLLQGENGWSAKGANTASHYVTEPQLLAQGHLSGRAVQGKGWLDHEWSDDLLEPTAVGWDWAGLNLADGSALTAFRLRNAQGRALWAGGSWRRAGSQVQAFAPQAVQWEPLQHWRSPATGAQYPVRWRLATPAGVYEVRALATAQEMDLRHGLGSAYWEGLSELLSPSGQRLGLGYLEMTGYAGRLKI